MRDQLVEPQAESTQGSGQAGADVDMHGLPPFVYARVMRLPAGEGGAEALVRLVKDFPSMEAQILEVASAHVGMSTVKQAMEIRESNPQGALSKKDQAEVRELAGADLAGPAPAASAAAPAANAAAPTQSEQVPGDLIIGRDKPKEEKAEKKAEPAELAGAQRYNDAHPTLVDEFNELTDHRLVILDEDSQLKPQAVAKWQKVRGLVADGKVGPQTVAAARADRAKSDVVAQANAGPKGELIDI